MSTRFVQGRYIDSLTCQSQLTLSLEISPAVRSACEIRCAVCRASCATFDTSLLALRAFLGALLFQTPSSLFQMKRRVRRHGRSIATGGDLDRFPPLPATSRSRELA